MKLATDPEQPAALARELLNDHTVNAVNFIHTLQRFGRTNLIETPVALGRGEVKRVKFGGSDVPNVHRRALTESLLILYQCVESIPGPLIVTWTGRLDRQRGRILIKGGLLARFKG